MLIPLLLLISLDARAADKEPTAMEHAARIYNHVQSVDRLYEFLKLGASDDDKAFLETLRARAAGKKFAKARAQRDRIWFQGLAKPLLAVNPGQGEFSYDGRKISFDWSRGVRHNYELLAKAVASPRVAWIDWLLPRAEASSDTSWILSGALAGAGVGMMVASPDPNAQALGGVMAMLGVFGLLDNYGKSSAKPMAATYPQSVTCVMDPYGFKRVYVNGANGSQLVSVTGGQPYQITPAPGYPLQYSQLAAGQLAGLCNASNTWTAVNYALAPPQVNPYYTGYAVPMSQLPLRAGPTRAPASAAPVLPFSKPDTAASVR